MLEREKKIEKRRTLYRKLEKTPSGKVRLAILRWLQYSKVSHCYLSLSFEAINALREMALRIAQNKIYINNRYCITQEHTEAAFALFDAWEVRCQNEDRRIVLGEGTRDWFATQFAELFADADVSTVMPMDLDAEMPSQMRH